MAPGRNNLCQKQRNDKNHGSHVVDRLKFALKGKEESFLKG